MEVHLHTRKTLWQRFKLDFTERFLKFETFNGAFVFIPWGWGFFYYGFPWRADFETFFYIISQPQFGYNYALISTGIVLMLWGFRKTFVNRVKQRAKFEESLEARKRM